MTAVFFAQLLFVFLKAFQQLNVQHHRVWWVVPTSVLMATAEVVCVVEIIRQRTLWLAIPMGLGGGLGCLVAMLIHRKLRHGH